MDAMIKTIRDRKHALKMRVRWLAKRANMSPAIAAQILRNRFAPSSTQLAQIAAPLGLRIDGDRLIETKSVDAIRREVASEKALFIARALQGTMLLEAAGVDRETLGGIVHENTQFFLSHPRQLWG